MYNLSEIIKNMIFAKWTTYFTLNYLLFLSWPYILALKFFSEMIRLYLHYYHVDSSGKYHANIMYEYNFRLYYTTNNKTTTKYNNCITIII